MNIKLIFAHPVSRRELSDIFGCSDRQAREKIAELQEKYNIVNFQDGKGYRLATDEQTIKYAMQEIRRATKIMHKAYKMLQRVNYTDANLIPVRAYFRRIKKMNKDNNQISIWE